MFLFPVPPVHLGYSVFNIFYPEPPGLSVSGVTVPRNTLNKSLNSAFVVTELSGI